MGLEAQGISKTNDLGGVSNIQADLAIVFDTVLDQIRIVAPFKAEEKMGELNSRILQRASISGLANA